MSDGGRVVSSCSTSAPPALGRLMHHHDELPRAPHAATRARGRLAEWFGDALEADTLGRARLITSELVNNAFLHGEGRIQLHGDLDDNRLRVEVVDEGAGFVHVVREVPFTELSGRGLGIVDAEASRWGVHQGSTRVWAELERPGPRVGESSKPDV